MKELIRKIKAAKFSYDVSEKTGESFRIYELEVDPFGERPNGEPATRIWTFAAKIDDAVLSSMNMVPKAPFVLVGQKLRLKVVDIPEGASPDKPVPVILKEGEEATLFSKPGPHVVSESLVLPEDVEGMLALIPLMREPSPQELLEHRHKLEKWAAERKGTAAGAPPAAVMPTSPMVDEKAEEKKDEKAEEKKDEKAEEKKGEKAEEKKGEKVNTTGK